MPEAKKDTPSVWKKAVAWILSVAAASVLVTNAKNAWEWANPAFSVAATGTYKEVPHPPWFTDEISYVRQFVLSPADPPRRVLQEGSVETWGAAVSMLRPNIEKLKRICAAEYKSAKFMQLSVINDGREELRNTEVILPCKGDCVIKYPGHTNDLLSFDGRIKLDDLRPDESAIIEIWPSNEHVSEFDLANAAVLHVGGKEPIEFEQTAATAPKFLVVVLIASLATGLAAAAILILYVRKAIAAIRAASPKRDSVSEREAPSSAPGPQPDLTGS